MKTKLFPFMFFVLAMLFFAVSASAYFYDGSTLVKSMREHEKAENKDCETDYSQAWRYRAYVIGVYDATASIYDTPTNVQELQICAIVAKYLKAHPEKWSEPASDLVITALKEAFPRER